MLDVLGYVLEPLRPSAGRKRGRAALHQSIDAREVLSGSPDRAIPRGIHGVGDRAHEGIECGRIWARGRLFAPFALEALEEIVVPDEQVAQRHDEPSRPEVVADQVGHDNEECRHHGAEHYESELAMVIEPDQRSRHSGHPLHQVPTFRDLRR